MPYGVFHPRPKPKPTPKPGKNLGTFDEGGHVITKSGLPLKKPKGR